MIADIKAMPKGSIVLLHACAHNPTGVDPSPEDWHAISDAVKAGEHFPFFDMAYQGFASGDTNKDAYALRYFVKEGHRPVLAQSFAKNMVGKIQYFHDGILLSQFNRRACTANASAHSPLSANLPKRSNVSTPRSRSSSVRYTPIHQSTAHV